MVRDPETAKLLPEGPVQHGSVQPAEPRGGGGPQQGAAVSVTSEKSLIG